MRYIKLTEEEKSKLNHLYKSSPNVVVRRRCLSLLLSDDKHSMNSVAKITQVNRTTLYYLYNAWESAHGTAKFDILSIEDGRGAKVKLEPVRELLPDLVNQHSRNLNPILKELQSKHNISVCKLTLQNFLKELGL